MDQLIKEKWLARLRSNTHKQGREHLRCGDLYCCLGILTEIYIEEHDLSWEELEDGIYSFRGAEELPPREVFEWAGLKNTDPVVDMPRSLGFACLTYLNDIDRLDFNQLADIIEAQL